MEQVYTPNYLVRAVPGYCLGYVDDAGNAPERTANAKIAYENEKKANRINLSELPDNVWVVVFFSFSKGGYWYKDSQGKDVYLEFKNLWHVALAKRSGNSMVIYDSEVQSGMRSQPYLAIQAVEAWFGAYGAKYVGWSTHCDGRQYAKNKEVNVDEIINVNCWRQLQFGILERNGLSGRPNALDGSLDKSDYVGRKLDIHVINELFISPEAKKRRDSNDYGSNVNIQKRLNERDAFEKENKQLKEQVKKLQAQIDAGGGFTKIASTATDIYIKK